MFIGKYLFRYWIPVVVQFYQIFCYLFAVVYVPYKAADFMELLPAKMFYPLVVRHHYLYRLSRLGLITFVN